MTIIQDTTPFTKNQSPAVRSFDPDVQSQLVEINGSAFDVWMEADAWYARNTATKEVHKAATTNALIASIRNRSKQIIPVAKPDPAAIALADFWQAIDTYFAVWAQHAAKHNTPRSNYQFWQDVQNLGKLGKAAGMAATMYCRYQIERGN